MNKLGGLPPPSMDWTASNVAETFRKFKRRVETLFKTPDFKTATEEELINCLKIFLGDEGQDIVDGFGFSDADSKILKKHWDKLDEYVKPKSNFRVARAQLRTLKQEPGETVDNFMTRARVLAADCQYTNTEEQLILRRQK